MNTIISQLPEFPVWVRCCTFNQSNYIIDALNGFVIQETNFPFVCSIFDDASTDGEQDVIQKYLDDNFVMESAIYHEIEEANIVIVRHRINVNCYFAVYFLKRNLYKQQDKKRSLYKPWEDRCKYIAICEGDDYWIDKLKLQKQFDWLESHDECMMCCSDAFIESQRSYVASRYTTDCDIPVYDMVCGGGGWIQTCTELYRKEVINKYKSLDFCFNCFVGDYCFQILSVLLGTAHYFSEKMCVYRYQALGSWTSKQNSSSILDSSFSIVMMLDGLNAESSFAYNSVFNSQIVFLVLDTFLHELSNTSSSFLVVYNKFEQFINKYNFSFNNKIDLFLLSHHLFFFFKTKRKISSLFRRSLFNDKTVRVGNEF